MARRAGIDWHTIAVDYQLGIESIKQLAKKHGVAESNLRRRAKAEGWGRDGAEAVRQARQSAMQEVKQRVDEIGARIGADSARLGQEVLEGAVIDSVEVVAHHKRIARYAMLQAQAILVELNSISGLSPKQQEDLKVLAQIDPATAALVERSASLRGRADTLERVASIIARIAIVERQAHDLDREESGKKSEVDALLLRVHQLRLAEKAQPGAGSQH